MPSLDDKCIMISSMDELANLFDEKVAETRQTAFTDNNNSAAVASTVWFQAAEILRKTVIVTATQVPPSTQQKEELLKFAQDAWSKATDTTDYCRGKRLLLMSLADKFDLTLLPTSSDQPTTGDESREQMVTDKVIGIIIDSWLVANVTPESHLENNLNADELDIVELLMALEIEFDIEIDDAEFDKNKTVGDIITFILEKTA